MSYENAPATKLLATNCCVCGRPLVDSVSVETGIGPDCRKKYGYGEGNEGEREVANVIVHQIAALWETAPKSDLLGSLKHLNDLGFVKLATKIATRIATVEVQEKDGRYVVFTPYSEATVQALRSVPGRRWNKEAKANEFPAASKPALIAVLRKLYAGQIGVGPKGVFVL